MSEGETTGATHPLAHPVHPLRHLLGMLVDLLLCTAAAAPALLLQSNERYPYCVALLLLYFGLAAYRGTTGRGQTPGRWLTRSTLVRFDGRSITLLQRILRTFFAFISFAAGGMGYFWCIYDHYGRTWHDRVSGTVVVSRRLT